MRGLRPVRVDERRSVLEDERGCEEEWRDDDDFRRGRGVEARMDCISGLPALLDDPGGSVGRGGRALFSLVLEYARCR